MKELKDYTDSEIFAELMSRMPKKHRYCMFIDIPYMTKNEDCYQLIAVDCEKKITCKIKDVK